MGNLIHPYLHVLCFWEYRGKSGLCIALKSDVGYPKGLRDYRPEH